MISGLIKFSIQYRTVVVLAAIVCALTGIYAAVHTPMDAVPDLSENQVIVFTSWPGHGPQEVEDHVTYPLSLQLQGLDGVRVVRGSSDMGYSMLHVIFEDYISFGAARQKVQERLTSTEVRLPEGVIPRLAADGIPTGQIYWYTVEGVGHDLTELRRLQDWTIAPQLRSVAGVAEVASVGGFVAELKIQVDSGLLAAYGLTVLNLYDELSRSTSNVGGHVVHKGNAEFVVQFHSDNERSNQISSWEQRLIPLPAGGSLPLKDVAKVAWGPAIRRGMFEKDGNEVVAGIVHLRYGHNPLEVTRQVRARLQEVARGLPKDVRIIPCYERTPLILGAVRTVTRALIEAILVAGICVLVVLRHFRAWVVIALTLPLSVLGTFLCMWLLRTTGVIDVQTNIMSLAGIVISIGVLVDSSIVMTENVMHRLRLRFGDDPVQGDVTDTIAAACQTVGWPVFCSVLVMLVSFTPVFALGGIDGRMYRPLALTKSLALISVAFLAVTLVPALCTFLVRGRIKDESDSAIVRSVIGVYRPMLSWLMDRPGPLIYFMSMTLVLASIPLGNDFVFRSVLFGSLTLILWEAVSSGANWRAMRNAVALIVMAIIGQNLMKPLGIEMRIPLDEGMVMDMPITIPRASITQSADDLKARNMVLCRFPEVAMVTGKAGRAETPFDPAPLDMIETMVEFRPREMWPKRRLLRADAGRMTEQMVHELGEAKLAEAVSPEEMKTIIDAVQFRFDAIQREAAFQLTNVFCHQLQQDLCRVLIEQIGQQLKASGQLTRTLSPADVTVVLTEIPMLETRELAQSPKMESISRLWPLVLESLEHHQLLHDENAKKVSFVGSSLEFMVTIGAAFGLEQSTSKTRVLAVVQREHSRYWHQHVFNLDRTLHQRTAPTWLRLVADECFSMGKFTDDALVERYSQIMKSRSTLLQSHDDETHHGLPSLSVLPLIDPHPRFDSICRRLSDEFSRSLLLWQHDAASLTAFEGEMDRALKMPGWTNVWTRPIQNRVDMLTTGINAEVGVRVLGRNLNDVVRVSEQIALVLKDLSGAGDVVADPIRGKGLIFVTPDLARAAEHGVSLPDLQAVLDTALSGRIVDHILDGRERIAVRLQTSSPSVEQDEESLRYLPVPCRKNVTLSWIDDKTGHLSHRWANTNSNGHQISSLSDSNTVPLGAVADIQVTEGPATIKSENGWLRNYVRMNVRERSPFEFVNEARAVVARQVSLPSGVFVEWTGQFEHAERTRSSLLFLIPIVLLIIFAMLYCTYRDWTDAALMLLSAPGALAGGLICQWILGYKFSVAVGVGYIACFGMAAATGIVMLVYLREAVDLAGGLERMTLPELKQAVLNGAVHRLRPKLLTEATTILGLAPMLWSDGIGAEVIRPMAAPVLGGILIADEVIDLLLPVLFYRIRRRRWLSRHSVSTQDRNPGNAESFNEKRPFSSIEDIERRQD